MVDKLVRPSPDKLLEQLKADEARKRRGKLKIFLGYAAGVGKTYAMLEAAQRQKSETDLVIAYVETHGRAETEALLSGLEVIPRKQVQYRGLAVDEMDLDAVLARRPKLALVDELAHTNTPGLRHPKRYQDVEELLEAGIDVYVTLNIQHLESLRESVAQITGVWVRETVPDSVIDEADEIELIDLPPDDLLQRLKEGKVYISEQISHAVANFFRKGNLSALREYSMRISADHIDTQVREYMSAHTIHGPWPTAERLLVCVTPGRWGSRIIHTARSLALQLNAEWTAIHVETPGSIDNSPEQQEQLTNLIRLAEKLGARVEILQGLSVANTILEYAYKNNITKIILGKPRDIHLRNILSRSVANQVVRRSKYVDVYIVSGKGQPLEQNVLPVKQLPVQWLGYLLSIALVSCTTLIGSMVHPFFHPVNVVMLYLLSIVISAIYFGFGPSILTSVLSLLAFDIFFIPPYFTFATSETYYLFTFAVLLAVGVVISYLTSRIRSQSEAAQRRENETATLYSLSKQLSVSIGLKPTLKTIIDSAKDQFKQNAVVFLPGKQKKEILDAYPEKSGIIQGENENAVAVWTYQHQKAAGYGTDTLPDASALYLPLSTAHGGIGVLALWPLDTENQLTVQQDRLLKAFADLASMAIERAQLAEAANDARVLEASQKLQTALLNSISHDLRTPLVSIIGVLSSLREESITLDNDAKNNLIQVALEEAERLNHLITNLLDVSRIEAGALKLSRQPADMQDIVGAALEQISSRYNTKKINVDMPDGLPLIPVDTSLIIQVLVNLLDNALKYSGADSIVDIAALQTAGEVQVEISDRGTGIPEQDLQHVFDKFYRVQSPDNVSGTGLGLSICRGIVEAHGGTISAENRPGGGTIIRIKLPVVSNSPERGRVK
ncbi:MAG: sensor histidine kinase KdpD [Dehalococcoidia bacterium]|nr:sensor histidine kinase KdpD [Dehalococcoidia bacterium]